MMLGPTLPLLLLALPVLVGVVVVLAGLFGLLFGQRAPEPLPRAVARVAAARCEIDDEATQVFHRPSFAR